MAREAIEGMPWMMRFMPLAIRPEDLQSLAERIQSISDCGPVGWKVPSPATQQVCDAKETVMVMPALEVAHAPA